MKKHCDLAWIEVIKYRCNGSTYYDYIIEGTACFAINNSYYNTLNQTKESIENIELDIAHNELLEIYNFIERT